jgi:hypothetical protein
MSARSTGQHDVEAAILGRVIAPDEGTLSPEAARSMLGLGFSRDDLAKMNDLAAESRAGQLTSEKDATFDSYLRVERFLALVQAKARH